MADHHAAAPSASHRRLSPAARGALLVAAPWTALVAPAPWSFVLVALLSLAAAALLVRDPDADGGVLLTMAAFTMCDLSPLSVDGSTVRLYQLSAVLALVVVVRRRGIFVTGLRSLERPPLAVLGVVLVLTALTPLSLLWTISPKDTLVSTVGQVSATGVLVLMAASVGSGLIRARQVLSALWAMATASSAWAFTQWLVTVVTPWELADPGGSGVTWPRPEGLMTESVWAALVAAVGLALVWVVRRDHPRLAMVSAALHFATLGLVGSRAVLLGMAVGAVICGAVVWRRHATPLRLISVVAACSAVVLILAVAAPAVLSRFDPRLIIGGQTGADGGSAQSRAMVYDLVADELPPRLPLGGGAGSLNKLTTDPEVLDRYADGGQLNSGRGSTNFFVGYAFDFGYLGALLSVALVLLVGTLAVRAARRDRGLSVFLATLFLVDFQFNNGFRFGFVHALLGVLVAVGSWEAHVASPPVSGQRSAGSAYPR